MILNILLPTHIIHRERVPSKSLPEVIYNVLTARNGLEAFQCMSALGPQKKDIVGIVLDQHMPIMDGVTFLELLHDRQCFTDIPVFIHTAQHYDPIWHQLRIKG